MMERLVKGKRAWLVGAAAVIALGFGAFALTSSGARDPAVDLAAGGEVQRVSGDHVKLKDGRVIEFAAIRLPYDHEPGAEKARKTLAKWVEDEGVRLQFDEQTEYKEDRILAYVYANDTFINERLVRGGYAFVKLRAGNRQRADVLLAAQREARENRKGVWAEIKLDPAVRLIGELERAAFHRPECPSAPAAGPDVVELTGTADAFDRGLAPCGKCSPIGGTP